MTHIKKITLRAVLAALIAAIAPLAIPIGTVPVTAATFIIFIVSATVSIKFSVPAVIIYIILGMAGLPVFSGFCGGIQSIVGPTGGYIIAYIPCAAVISLLCSKFCGKKFIYPISMLAGNIICYFFGTLWYSFQADCTILSATSVCILPFIAGDIIKIISASVIVNYTKPKIYLLNTL